MYYILFASLIAGFWLSNHFLMFYGHILLLVLFIDNICHALDSFIIESDFRSTN